MEEVAKTAEVAQQYNFWNFGNLVEAFNSGAPWTWLILALGVACLVIFLERFYVLYFQASVSKENFLGQIQRAVLAGDLNAAVNYCNNRSTPLNNIVKAGIISVMNKGKDEEIQTSMDVASLREIPVLERRTAFLALFANVATLVGLLATIVGLIIAFHSVASEDPAAKAAILADGVAQAMHGTAMGLLVAIPALLAYSVLSAKTQKILDDIHETSVAMLNLIIQNRDKFPTR
jgi:biopolymer transport protein ExbB